MKTKGKLMLIEDKASGQKKVKKNNFLLVSFIIILLCISTAFALEQYLVNEPISVVISLFNDTGTELIPVEDQVCNGSVYFYENTSWIIQDTLLTNHTGGLHNFTFTPTEIGEYGIFVECWVNSDLAAYQRKIEVLNETFGGGNETLENLIYNETLLLVEENEMIGQTMLFSILLIIAFVFLAAGYLSPNSQLKIFGAAFSSFLFFILAYAIIGNQFGEKLLMAWLATLLVALGIIQAIYTLLLVISLLYMMFTSRRQAGMDSIPFDPSDRNW